MTNQELSLTLLQPNIVWENKAANFAQYDAILQKMPTECNTDILLLPEMFATGFSMNAPLLAEPTEGPTLAWMRQWAMHLNCAVTGSCIVVEESENNNPQYYNRALWVEPSGNYLYYDKRHLFRMGGENNVYAAGQNQVCIEWRNWRIGLLVCYDLRFPVWARRCAAFDYDCLLYMANWPAVRIFAWTQLLIARAIENQAYAIGINRVGDDGHQIAHNGHSMVVNYLGETLLKADNTNNQQTALYNISLSKNNLQSYRQNFPAWADADNFIISS